ncbi:MAG: DUF2024 family protein [Flavobacteriaceae bacterium]|nr:DUF2024 family protein [Flavobacteriaceae bacterium]
MKVAVWDTYVQRLDGEIMHFDILVPDTLKDEKEIFEYGEKYLSKKPIETEGITMSHCNFCHIEKAPMDVENSVKENGYHIIEMENCD